MKNTSKSEPEEKADKRMKEFLLARDPKASPQKKKIRNKTKTKTNHSGKIK